MKFERLIKLVRKCKVSPFLRAGFSIEAKAPSVDDLKTAILSEFDNEELRNEHKETPKKHRDKETPGQVSVSHS